MPSKSLAADALPNAPISNYNASKCTWRLSFALTRELIRRSPYYSYREGEGMEEREGGKK